MPERARGRCCRRAAEDPPFRDQPAADRDRRPAELPRGDRPPPGFPGGAPLPGGAARVRRASSPVGQGRRPCRSCSISGWPNTAASWWRWTTGAPRAAGGPGNGRSRASCGDVPLADQVAGLQALGRQHPELDLERVGVYGWSFGGYLSALAVLRRPDVFKVAVAGAPVVDWRDYDTHYTERYLDLPDREAAALSPVQPAQPRRSAEPPAADHPRHRGRQRLLLPLAQAGGRPVSGGQAFRLPAAAAGDASDRRSAGARAAVGPRWRDT